MPLGGVPTPRFGTPWHRALRPLALLARVPLRHRRLHRRPAHHAAFCRELVDAEAKNWGSIERAKRMIQRLEAESRRRGEEARAKVQAKKR